MDIFIPMNGDNSNLEFLLPESGDTISLPDSKIVSPKLRKDLDGFDWEMVGKQGDFTWWYSRSRMLRSMNFLGYQIEDKK